MTTTSQDHIEVVLPPKERFRRLEANANEFLVDKNQPIRRYYRSGAEMIRMADTYYEENNYQSAYILYYKYLTLFIEKVVKHPEYKQVPLADRAKVRKMVKSVMPKSELLKQEMRKQFEIEYEDYLQALEAKRIRDEVRMEEFRQAKLRAEGENLRKEISQYRDEKVKNVQTQRDLEVAMWYQLKLDQEEEANRPSSSNSIVVDRSTKPVSLDEKKPEAHNHFDEKPVVPDRSTKPSMSLYSDNLGSSGIRTLIVPSLLMAKFLSLAQPNTANDVETCGILSGQLARNQFKITHLLIPKQTGTANTCTTECEEAIIDFQEEKGLITLGWIHTHPSQTAFLSSMDLHTHLPYQLMLPEAVAIVVSPKFNETGFFVLTPDYGLDYLANCRETGFHPHPSEPPLFCEGKHVKLDDGEDVELVDLR